MARRYQTDLHCGACVAKIRPHFDAAPGVAGWSVDLAPPVKVLTVEGGAGRSQVDELLGRVGFRVTGEVDAPAPEAAPPAPAASYYPLALVVGYIAGVVALVELTLAPADGMRAMANFMAGFFLVFSFFKLLDVRAFADAYAGYDLVAARSRAYALAFPFVELALGVAYLTRFAPAWTSAATLVVMLVSLAGVLNSVLRRRAIRCACLGSVFTLPMSVVTVAEDATMALMAAAMLARHAL